MTKWPTIWPNILYQQTNAELRLLQMWVVGLMLVCAEAKGQGRGNSNRACHNRADGSFDYFYFVLQWPGSYCSKGCCYNAHRPLPRSQFTVHGLWPAHIGGKGPCYCGGNRFLGFNQIPRGLYRDLMEKWASFKCPTPNTYGLWRHEWEKHGSCSKMNDITFLQAAMTLHTVFDIREAFRVEGILPNGELYDIVYMRQVIQKYIGEPDSIITCRFNVEHQVDEIYEVFICLDKVNLQAIPCPDARTFKTKCKTSFAILFPAFTPARPLPQLPLPQPPLPPSCPAPRTSGPATQCTPGPRVRVALNPSESNSSDDEELLDDELKDDELEE